MPRKGHPSYFSMSSRILRSLLGIALLLAGAPAVAELVPPNSSGGIDYGFCGGKPMYPVIGVNFSTFCGPRNQIGLGRRGLLMWSFPEADGLRFRAEGKRQLTETELAELVTLAEAAQIAPAPPARTGPVRYDFGIDFVGRPIRQQAGALEADGSSTMALIDALRRLVPDAPLLPKCSKVPPDTVFSPTLLPDERRAALAEAGKRKAAPTPSRHGAHASPASSPPMPLPEGSAGLTISPPKPIEPRTLSDQDGANVVFPSKDGRWKLAFFGYTHCPDVCPMTLHKLTEVLDLLGPQGRGLETFFISVDSQRDHASQVKAFLAAFDAPVTGLTTDPDTLRALSDEFGVLIRRSQGQSALAYSLRHSSSIYLLDPQGELRRFYTGTASAEAIAGELAQLLPRTPASTATTTQSPPEHAHHHGH